ncbi:MAG: tetratricopeptide repeat protein, partial [Bacteroidota bacterium]
MRYLILLLILACAIPLSAQVTLSTKSKEAKALYVSATKKYDINDFKGALEDLEKAIKKDPKFVEAHMLMGDIYADTKEYEKGAASYSNAIKADPEYYRGNYFNLALCQMKSGKYDEAISNFQKYKSLLRNDPAGIKKIELYIKSSEFAANAIKNPVPFIYHNLGDSVNSPYDEYLPTITADEQTLIFTRREPADQNTIGKQNAEEEDFYES